MNKEKLEQYRNDIKDKSPEAVLAYFLDEFGDKIVLASSLGAEDQALTHMVLSHNENARIFVLDTGRLNPETYDTIEKTQLKYKHTYEVQFPERADVEAMVQDQGINGFYNSIENRKACCYARKVAPLRRVLSTADAWITGLRQAQSVTRADLEIVEWDDTHNMFKINPLAAWSNDDVWAYIKANNIPTNDLHDKGFPSIGCAPCTRAIEPGEDIRAGRWWWENPEQKECGLHVGDKK